MSSLYIAPTRPPEAVEEAIVPSYEINVLVPNNELNVLVPNNYLAYSCWSPNGQYVAIAWGEQLCIVHHPTQHYRYVQQTEINVEIAFSPSNQHLALSSPCKLQIYDVHANLLIERQQNLLIERQQTDMFYSPRQKSLWSADGTRLLWGQQREIVLLAEEPLQISLQQKLRPYLRSLLVFLRGGFLLYNRDTRRALFANHSAGRKLATCLYVACSLGVWTGIGGLLNMFLPSIAAYAIFFALMLCFFSAYEWLRRQKTPHNLFHFEKKTLPPLPPL